MSIQLHFNSAVVAVLSLAGSFLLAATQLSSEEITFPLFPEDSGTERRDWSVCSISCVCSMLTHLWRKEPLQFFFFITLHGCGDCDASNFDGADQKGYMQIDPFPVSKSSLL